jgi:hypothetical protein
MAGLTPATLPKLAVFTPWKPARMCRTTMTLERAGNTWLPCAIAVASDSFVNGKLCATSDPFDNSDYDIANKQPLLIGLGEQNHFSGALDDVRIYSGALSHDQVSALYGGT